MKKKQRFWIYCTFSNDEHA